MSVLDSRPQWSDDAHALKRFGMALAQDGRLGCDPPALAALVERLIQRTLLADRRGEGPRELSGRSRRLALFIRFHRRHIRLEALEESDWESERASGGESDATLTRAMRDLPYEHREALLLVAIERLSHVEAACVLEIPLAALVDRLARARAGLALALPAPANAPLGLARPARLRLVK